MPGTENIGRPSVGDIDTVIDTFDQFGNWFYALERFGINNGYRTDFFATLPTSTTDEMEEEVKEAIIM
jgi:hypothetical protein